MPLYARPRYYPRYYKRNRKSNKKIRQTASYSVRGKSLATYRPTAAYGKATQSWPLQMSAHLPYCEILSFNASSTVPATRTFRTNSLYDPSLTGSHQPLGFDQYMNVYRYYACDSSYIKVYHQPRAVAEVIPGFLAVFRSTDSTPPTFADQEHFLEWCKDQKVKVVPIGSFTSALDSASKPLSSCAWSMQKAFGIDTTETNTWGTASTNPGGSTTSYYHVIVYMIDGNDPGEFFIRIEMGFNARFFEREVISES